MGDIPAVRERRGSLQGGRFTKQDDNVMNRIWLSQRGEVTHKQMYFSDTHTLLLIPRHTLSSNQRAQPELFQVLQKMGKESVERFPLKSQPSNKELKKNKRIVTQVHN